MQVYVMYVCVYYVCVCMMCLFADHETCHIYLHQLVEGLKE